MALKPRQEIGGVPEGIDDRLRYGVVPVLFKRDLEEHKRLPRVKARLARVERLLANETR